MALEYQADIYHCPCRICQAGSDPITMQYHHHINLLLSRLTEPQRRWYLGALVQAPHSRGIRQLARITGMDPKTIRRGRREIASGLADLPPERQRRAGAGQGAAEKKTRRSKP